MAMTQTASQTPNIKIIPNDGGGAPGKLADAELYFTDGTLAGLRLIGFRDFASGDSGVRCPSRRPRVRAQVHRLHFRCAERGASNRGEVGSFSSAAAFSPVSE